jgi:hypothetical protein
MLRVCAEAALSRKVPTTTTHREKKSELKEIRKEK